MQVFPLAYVVGTISTAVVFILPTLLVSAIIVRYLGGDFKAFLTFFGWSVFLWLGIFCFIIPGIVILAFLLRRYGLPSLFLLLGPVGAAVLAVRPPAVEHSPGYVSYRIGAELPVDILLLTVLAFLSVFGVLSKMLAPLPMWATFIFYVSLVSSLSLSTVHFVDTSSLRSLMVSLLLFAVLLGTCDVFVKGLGLMAVSVPLSAGPGVMGATRKVALVASLPLILSSFVGCLVRRRGTGWIGTALAVILSVLGSTMILALACSL